MFLGIYDDSTGNHHVKLYFFREQWHKDTFSPDCTNIQIIDFSIRGHNYAARKADLRELAIDFQGANTEGISWLELAKISDFFTRNAKKYGLTNEFRENGII